MSTNRHLNWEGCFNVRDLGGLPLVGGGETRHGVLIRADLLGRLTEAGKAALVDYGIGTIFDLREESEAAREPTAVFTAGTPAIVNIPLVDDFDVVEEQMGQSQSWVDVYGVFLDNFQTNHAAVISAIAAVPAGSAFHCFSGKDRTGIVSALLLELAGVDREAIAADYALSQERLWPQYEEMAAEAGGEEHIAYWYRPLTSPETMLATLAHLDNVYGGVEAYLRQGGLAAADIEQLREKLVG